MTRKSSSKSSIHKVREVSVLDDDLVAMEQARQAQADGTAMIRSHLSSHLENNPDSSYVSWIATLHPENSDVTIDTRFLIPGNQHWRAYEDAKDPVTATEVTIIDPSVKSSARPPDETSRSDHYCMLCSPFDLFAGSMLAFAALLTTWVVEITGAMLYIFAAAFFHLAKLCAPPNICTGIFYSFFALFYWILATMDSVLLLASVLVTEMTAVIAFCFSLILGGCASALRWHQYIRLLCHHSRMICRKHCTSPQRHFCDLDYGFNKQSQQEVETVVAIPVPAPTTIPSNNNAPTTIPPKTVIPEQPSSRSSSKRSKSQGTIATLPEDTFSLGETTIPSVKTSSRRSLQTKSASATRSAAGKSASSSSNQRSASQKMASQRSSTPRKSNNSSGRFPPSTIQTTSVTTVSESSAKSGRPASVKSTAKSSSKKSSSK